MSIPYISIHPHRMMVSFNDIWFMRYLYILKVIEVIILKSVFLKNLSPTARNLRGRDFIYIVLQEFRKYINFNLLLATLQHMTL